MALNVVSADEHVPKIERYIRTVKKRTRCIYNTVPFKRMPTTMVIEMVRASVFGSICSHQRTERQTASAQPG
jgi:hypothetical protein